MRSLKSLALGNGLITSKAYKGVKWGLVHLKVYSIATMGWHYLQRREQVVEVPIRYIDCFLTPINPINTNTTIQENGKAW